MAVQGGTARFAEPAGIGNHPRSVCKIHRDSRSDTISSSFRWFAGKFDARISYEPWKVKKKFLPRRGMCAIYCTDVIRCERSERS